MNIDNKNIGNRDDYKKDNFTLKDIALWVKENRSNYYFIKDTVGYESSSPLSNSEYNRLTFLLKEISYDHSNKVRDICSVYDKIPKEDFLLESLKEYESLKPYKKDLEEKIGGYNKDIIEQLIPIKEVILNMKEEAKKLEESNSTDLLEKYASNNYMKDISKNFAESLNSFITDIKNLKEKLKYTNIKISSNIDLNKFKKDFSIIYKELRKNSKLNFWTYLSKRNTLRILRKCKINNKAVSNKEHLNIIRDYINLKVLEEKTLLLWNKYNNEFGFKEVKSINDESLAFIEKHLNIIEIVIGFDKKYKAFFIMTMKDNWYNNLNLYKFNKIEEFYNKVCEVEKLNKIKTLEKTITDISLKLKENIITSELLIYVREFNYEKIEEYYSYINNMLSKKDIVEEILYLTKDLKEVMPLFYKDLQQDKIIDLNFEEAFQYAKYNSLLNGCIKYNKNSKAI